MMPMIVSFYTPEYADWARDLIDSCVRFDLAHSVEPRPMLGGDWRARCAEKGPFILERARQYAPRPVLWIDADSEVKAPLSLFDDPSFDLAVTRSIGGNVRSGTVYASPAALPILETCALLCREHPDNGHERNLHRAIALSRGDLRVETLDPGYNRIATEVLGPGRWAGVVYILANGRSGGGAKHAKIGKVRSC